MKYYIEKPWFPLSLIQQNSRYTTEKLALSDYVPITKYEEAIYQVVNAGDVVLNLSTGTGLLDLWALKAGAKRVYGVEEDAAVLSLAVDRINAAGYGEYFVPINSSSFGAVLSERVDVLIFENIGNLGDNESFSMMLSDARERFLKEDGTSIPKSVQTYLVPVSAEKAHSDILEYNISSLYEKLNIKKFLQSEGLTSNFNIYYDMIVPKQSYLSDPQLVKEYYGNWNQKPTYSKDLVYVTKKDGLLTGFKGYFVAQLSDNIVLDISEEQITRRTVYDDWRHAYLPIENPIATNTGDHIRLCYSRKHPEHKTKFDQILRWQGEVVRDKKVIGRFDQCLDESVLGNIPQ